MGDQVREHSAMSAAQLPDDADKGEHAHENADGEGGDAEAPLDLFLHGSDDAERRGGGPDEGIAD